MSPLASLQILLHPDTWMNLWFWWVPAMNKERKEEA